MPRFRKKPVVIEAAKVSDLLASFEARVSAWPPWALAAFESGSLRVGTYSIAVVTLEGDMAADRADVIIRGIKGELYPCKPDIFEATYEAVESELGPSACRCAEDPCRCACHRGPLGGADRITSEDLAKIEAAAASMGETK